MIPSYSSIYNLGHAAIADLLKSPVIVEEKIDGSQFSFTKQVSDGELICRSKGARINMLAPEGMFIKAVEFVQANEARLTPGLVYRGEYLRSPKHNVLVYDRIPNNHVMIFDIERGEQTFCPAAEKVTEAGLVDLECVPVLFEGMLTDVTLLRELLARESVLGGQKIEGVVIKPANYDLFGRDKKVLMGKFVSEAFKEVHAAEWKKDHATKGPGEIIQILAAIYATPARWAKALIHLREAGVIENSPKDIGALMAEVPPDVLKECEAEIREQLFQWAWPQLRRSLTRGLPQWYKNELMALQFNEEADQADRVGEPTSEEAAAWSPDANLARSVALAE